MRWLPAILVVALLLQGSSVARAASAGSCATRCPDDDDEGRCPPECALCGCCAHLQAVIITVEQPAVAPAARPHTYCERVVVPPSPDPADLLHVPKLLA